MRIREWVSLFVLVIVVALLAAGPAGAQVNTATLSGQVLDPKGLAMAGAKVTVRNLANNAARSIDTDEEGNYVLVSLPPGRYSLTVESPGFAKYEVRELELTIGASATFNVTLQIQTGVERVVVVETTAVIEAGRTAVAETVGQRQITNLPTNTRNYLGYTLLQSQAQRDSAPSIGAAPTSGINFQGQRARSNQVAIDGANAVDNSINGVRTTLPQEAVQEFQIIMSNYMPEFGQATGGVVNIVSKSGANEVHGNAFAYFRHKNIQARNPFSVEVDPTTGQVRGVKQGFTRVQPGVTLGGPIAQDKTFYFFAYEASRRQETGFTNIGSGNFGLTATTTPLVPGATLFLTPTQVAFINNAAVAVAARATYAALAGSASNVALFGIDFGAVATAFGVPSAPGARFPIPLDCLPPAIPCTAANLVPLPASYVPLTSLIGNYPTKEGTSYWSARLDHVWNQNNNSFVRVNVTPSLVTGIQVNAQNQNFGQNAATRTSLQQVRDVAVVGQHMTSFSPTLINEARFQFARRGLHYGFADFPGGDRVAINMTGTAFFGREPFSTVDRIERRWQWTDNLNWIKGSHSFKFGGDVNLIQLRSKKDQIFELNFGGLYNFGAIAASAFAAFGIPATAPSFIRVQAYGLGLPQVFIQGIGTSNQPFNNTALAFFAQDSWKIHPRVTLNYGVRYDYEHTPLFPAATMINQAAEQAFGILEGIPRDKNNWSPRLGLAWDPTGSGNWLVRAGYGIFYDHPLLAIAFNSFTAEGAQSSQLVVGGGSATRAAITPLNAATALNAASIFQGVLNGPASFGYLSSQQRFDPKLASSIFVDHNFLTSGIAIPLLPFTLHVDDAFEYAYSQQGNLTVERKLGDDYKVSLAYTYTHAVHLNRPRNVNTTDPARLSRNFRNALAAGLTPSSPLAVAAPVAPIAATANTCGVAVIAPGALGALTGCPAALAALNGQFLGTAAFFNLFRPSGPNPSFATLAGGYANQVALATAAGYPTGFSGVQVPWSDVLQQESSGNSVYHGMTLTVSKRFSKHFEFLSSWTWSKAIDDSTDLQTLLAPQNNNRPDLERALSTFDQRNRWVTSAVFFSPFERSNDGWWRKFLADFTVAPIIELASGRPFTVLTGTDFNLDLGSNTDRPSTGGPGVASIFLPQANPFNLPNVCPNDPLTGMPIPPPLGCTGNLGRNVFHRPGYYAVDLRISRKFPVNDKWNIEFIADVFNLFNRFNTGDVSPVCDPLDPAACRAGEPTASLDPRQFQFGLKINW